MELRKSFRKGTLCLIVGLLVFGLCGFIQAAEESEDDYILEDTVVTATKTGETRLQETPISLTVFDPETLKAGGVAQFKDLGAKTPGMNFTENAQGTMIFIRGIGNDILYPGGNESVGIYLDDVYLNRFSGFWSAYLDVERIEVLRGPQGTLYGRNTSGGAVRVMTQNPTDEVSGYFSGELGNENHYLIEGAIGGPIVKDKLKARIAFRKGENDGYIDNVGPPGGPETVDADDKYAVRGKLQFTPSEKIDILLAGDYSRRNFAGGFARGPTDTSLLVAAGAVPFKVGEEVALNPIPGQHQIADVKGVMADIKIQLPGTIQARSITAYRESEVVAPFFDLDGSTLDIYGTSQKSTMRQTSQEFQLNGKWGALSWVSGLVYSHDFDYNTNQSYLNVMAQLVPIFVDKTQTMETDSWAGYASGIYAFTDRLSVTAGLRYTRDEKDIERDNFESVDLSALFGLPLGSIVQPSFYDGPDSDEWSDLSPKLGLDYRLSDDIFLYASITKGYKGGGFNGTDARPSEAFNEEIVWSYEVGAKTDWFDKRLRLNTSLFYYDYSDLQVRFVITGTGGSVSVIENAAQSTVYGGELEILARPVPPLSIGVNLAYTHSEFDEYLGVDLAGAPADHSGNNLIYAPEWTFNCFLTYSIPVQDYGFVTLYTDYDWKDDRYSHPSNDDLMNLGSHGLFNAQVSFETQDGKWHVDLYGKNLSDEKYHTFSAAAGSLADVFPGGVAVNYSMDARRYGVRVGYRF
ncbi:MAG: TonB-dependent receptor [Deltaproteobacteria bacterium]|nr:TonB-dependent receptor [Deltaproteobacteria bacterium]